MEHVPDENEKKAHRSILRYFLTSNDVSYTLSVQNEHFFLAKCAVYFVCVSSGQRIFFDKPQNVG